MVTLPGLQMGLVDAKAIFDLVGTEALKGGRKYGHRKFGFPVTETKSLRTDAHTGVKVNLLGAQFEIFAGAVGGVFNTKHRLKTGKMDETSM